MLTTRHHQPSTLLKKATLSITSRSKKQPIEFERDLAKPVQKKQEQSSLIKKFYNETWLREKPQILKKLQDIVREKLRKYTRDKVISSYDNYKRRSSFKQSTLHSIEKYRSKNFYFFNKIREVIMTRILLRKYLTREFLKQQNIQLNDFESLKFFSNYQNIYDKLSKQITNHDILQQDFESSYFKQKKFQIIRDGYYIKRDVDQDHKRGLVPTINSVSEDIKQIPIIKDNVMRPIFFKQSENYQKEFSRLIAPDKEKTVSSTLNYIRKRQERHSTIKVAPNFFRSRTMKNEQQDKQNLYRTLKCIVDDHESDQKLKKYLKFQLDVEKLLSFHLKKIRLTQFQSNQINSETNQEYKDFDKQKIDNKNYQKDQQKRSQFHLIKRNTFKNKQNQEYLDYQPNDLPSLTEIQLDKQYKKSSNIQQQIITALHTGKIHHKIKQIQQLGQISKQIESFRKIQLRTSQKLKI